MAKETLTGKTEEQYVCPDCGKAVDYKDIGKYKRGLPAELMEMDFREFIKQKTGIYQSRSRLANLCDSLYEGRISKGYTNLPNGQYKPIWCDKISKVKDIYSLSEREIYGVRNVGKGTWESMNEALEKNNLAPLKLPYCYSVTYPLKKASGKKK